MIVRAATALLLSAVFVAGCRDGLLFTQDDRLRIVSPGERERVLLPVVVDWRADAALEQPGRLYGVFVDRSPMRPGRSLDSLAAEDPVCRATPGCPDRDWLRSRNVHLTRRSAITLRALPAGRERFAPGGHPRHEVTIVLLDSRGARVGEAAWRRVFYGPPETER